MHRALDPALALRRLEGEHPVGAVAHFPAPLRRSRPFHDGEARQLLNLCTRHAGRECEVEAVQRLYGGEAGYPSEHVLRVCPGTS